VSTADTVAVIVVASNPSQARSQLMWGRVCRGGSGFVAYNALIRIEHRRGEGTRSVVEFSKRGRVYARVRSFLKEFDSSLVSFVNTYEKKALFRSKGSRR